MRFKGSVCEDEMGFAHFLGKQAIWTSCRKHLDEHVRFHLRQPNIVTWGARRECNFQRAAATGAVATLSGS